MNKIYLDSRITAEDELNAERDLPSQRIVDKCAAMMFGDIDGFHNCEERQHFDHCEWVARGTDLFLVNTKSKLETKVNFS